MSKYLTKKQESELFVDCEAVKKFAVDRLKTKAIVKEVISVRVLDYRKNPLSPYELPIEITYDDYGDTCIAVYYGEVYGFQLAK